MSYTFICTPAKEWYCKITTIEQLMAYWSEVFNPKLKEALDTIGETKEYGRGFRHCNEIQAMIGFMARARGLSYDEAYDEIAYDTRKSQYQALCNGEIVYINKKMGWCVDKKETEQFVHKTKFEFPVMKEERLKIEQFPLGTHWYIFIDGVQLRQKDSLKFDTYNEAHEFAQSYFQPKKDSNSPTKMGL